VCLRHCRTKAAPVFNTPPGSKERAPLSNSPVKVRKRRCKARLGPPMGALLQLIGEASDDQIATEAQRRSGVMQCPPRTPQLLCRPRSNRHATRDSRKRERICWGTEGSNPSPSSGESRANLDGHPDRPADKPKISNQFGNLVEQSSGGQAWLCRRRETSLTTPREILEILRETANLPAVSSAKAGIKCLVDC